jgi:hypothetical protein
MSDAQALYERAEARWLQVTCIPGRAEALLGQGRCRISLGWNGAEEPLTEARNLFDSMGYESALAEAEELLAAAAAPSS